MAEKTLNEALSGAEIKEIILQEIGKRLDGDCTLLDTLAYSGFSAKFILDISYRRSLTKPTMVWGEAKVDNEPSLAPDAIGHIEGMHISSDSPDVERQSHDLAIPVLVQTPTGAERQKVRLGRGPGRPPGSKNVAK